MKKLIFTIIILFFLLTPIATAYALDPIVPECAKSTEGDNICCMMYVISNLSRWILGVMGAFALLFFIIGGLMWITSAGSAEKVKKGQSLMVNTVIGIIIIVVAWLAVNFIIISLAKPEGGDFILKGLKGADKSWYNLCEGQQGLKN